jgi:GNAT superfamily N-acetyltransferase
MSIRKAIINDKERIVDLLEQLGYPDTGSFIEEKMISIFNNAKASLLVYEVETTVVAFMAIDFITQIALKGDFARISYFAVDDKYRSNGIGKEMEEYFEKLAKEKNCDRTELHCSDYRTEAHKFYFRQGYVESPKYLMKKIS